MVTEYYRWLQSTTDGYSVLQMVTEYYRWLQCTTDGYSVLQMVTVYYSRACAGLNKRTSSTLIYCSESLIIARLVLMHIHT